MINYLKQQGINDWIVLFAFGSQNYNLSTPNSDKDYRVLTLKGSKETKSYFYNNYDIKVNQVFQFKEKLINMEQMYTELLFSNQLVINTGINCHSVNAIKQLIANKNKIITMNLPKMYQQRIFEVNVEINKLNHAKTFSVLTSHMHHLYRILDMLDRFYETDFQDYEYAIRYDNNDSTRDLLMKIKNCQIEKNQYETIINAKIKKILLLKNCFEKHSTNFKIIKLTEDLFSEIE